MRGRKRKFLSRAVSSSLRKALFLDRDGVINVDGDYVHLRRDFVFIDGIFDLCRAAREKGYLLIVITNQSGIGRGFYSEQDFRVLMDWVTQRFDDEGAPVDGVYHCPHAPGAGCACRKPKPGMLLQAARERSIDLAASIFIGNTETDMEAGLAAGVGKNVLVTPYRTQTKASHCIAGLEEAAGLL
jgi:D-glycero-D-manno-heptose 1,7-bisphosphate phosphatase